MPNEIMLINPKPNQYNSQPSQGNTQLEVETPRLPAFAISHDYESDGDSQT